MKKILQDYSLDELKSQLTELGVKMPRMRAEQLYRWANEYVPFFEMTNIPKDVIELLQLNYDEQPIQIYKKFESKDGTLKYVFKLFDGNMIEGVLMKYKYGNTICVSTQVGCRMGCLFCATGLDGMVRNLSAGEILGQVLAVNHDLGGTVSQRQITNIVLMGCGEPLDNFDNVVKFIELVSSSHGSINISQRNISLSTCGIAPKIKALADLNLGITLTISLHATTDEFRKQIMKIANAYSLADLFEAINYYFKKTGRRVMFEYILLDKNTTVHDARRIKSLCKGLSYHFNLIPINMTPNAKVDPLLKPAGKTKTAEFWQHLKDNNISATTRRTLGEDISGACGQLRRKVIKEGEQ
ncbi:MAG: 23S rRNA (adenine(2503)-C(2))-methyltransferase RlmN [Clostridia bacterium]|nr:23S rRNA (adenine(2503)-C(2))-methyltransferase RlmN [Clostridia bacterium]